MHSRMHTMSNYQGPRNYRPPPTMSSEDRRRTVRVIYGTTQKASSSGQQERLIYVICPGTMSETTLGTGDAPGWWVWHDGKQKFFVSSRIRMVAAAADDEQLYQSAAGPPAVADGPASGAASLYDSSEEESDAEATEPVRKRQRGLVPEGGC